MFYIGKNYVGREKLGGTLVWILKNGAAAKVLKVIWISIDVQYFLRLKSVYSKEQNNAFQWNCDANEKHRLLH